MSSPDITRRLELFLCQQLQTALPTYTFLPFAGGDLTNDSFEKDPPYVVINAREAQKMFDQESTWLVRGNAMVITDSDDTKAPDHAIFTREVYSVIGGLPAAVESDFAFHGLSVDLIRSAVDDEARARAGVIEWTAGCGG